MRAGWHLISKVRRARLSAVTTPDLSVDLAPTNPHELRLRNPVIAASGCFGYGEEYAGIIDVGRLGAFVSKGITPHAAAGTPCRASSSPRPAC